MRFFPAPLRSALRTLIAQARTRHGGRRLLALAAAVAVPAMAAPEDWHGFDFAPGAHAEVKPMAFETPGESFPGSAFFYLEDLPQLAEGGAPPPLDTGAHWDSDERAPGQANDSPIARAFREAGTGLDQARALQCLTLAVYYEAGNEPLDGERAVAQVILNRVAHPSFPNSVCGVVFQGSERRTGCQFTFTCDGSLNRRPARMQWDRAQQVAAAALNGYVFTPIGLATHYHATYVLPYWASSLENVGTIGLHTFYRWRGAAGRGDAFQVAYRGDEPVAAPHPLARDPDAGSAPDPIVLAQAYEAARMKAAAQAAALAPPPAYAAAVAARGGDRQFVSETLPSVSGIKAEYANSGRWIAQPGGAPAPAPPAAAAQK
ncbi:MAG: cell wall hydrolase [Tsuneonella sp.]